LLLIDFPGEFSKVVTVISKIWQKLKEMAQMSKVEKRTMRGNFSIGDIGPIALALGVAIIFVALIVMFLEDMLASVSNTSSAYTLIGLGITAIEKFGSWFGNIVNVVIITIVLGLLYMLYRYAGSRNGP